MKYAAVDGVRVEATPGLKGDCPACGAAVVAKCGSVRIHHWAHKSDAACDHWWEAETEWHRIWKNLFPETWQEYPHATAEGIRHIADVRTAAGWVLEFQHSAIHREERHSRNAFYTKLIWVVDGKRRKSDAPNLLKALNSSIDLGGGVRRVTQTSCALLREWAETKAPVFFDFGGNVLWWVFARDSGGAAYVAPYSRDDFIQIHLGTAPALASEFFAFVADLPGLIEVREATLRTRAPGAIPPRPAPRRHRRF